MKTLKAWLNWGKNQDCVHKHEAKCFTNDRRHSIYCNYSSVHCEWRSTWANIHADHLMDSSALHFTNQFIRTDLRCTQTLDNARSARDTVSHFVVVVVHNACCDKCERCSAGKLHSRYDAWRMPLLFDLKWAECAAYWYLMPMLTITIAVAHVFWSLLRVRASKQPLVHSTHSRPRCSLTIAIL